MATMERLYDAAADFVIREPWKLLDESELVLVKPPLSCEVCHCSVMGALGEVFSMHAYLGAESYRLFKQLEFGAETSIGEFFANQHSIYLEVVAPGRLEVADRELLKAIGHPLSKAVRAPMFRTIRPGFHSWFVTENEAQILAECLRAVIALCDLIRTDESLDYWAEDGVYPMVLRDEEGDPHYRIATGKVAYPATPLPEPARLDEDRVRRIREGDFPSRSKLELDHFYGGAMIGRKNERKACFRAAMAIDAETAFAYHPELATPSTSTGDVLVTALLNAIEKSRALPCEVHVKQLSFEAALAPLAKGLGFQIRIVKSLPALDYAKEHLLRMMGDPGPLKPL